MFEPLDSADYFSVSVFMCVDDNESAFTFSTDNKLEQVGSLSLKDKVVKILHSTG